MKKIKSLQRYGTQLEGISMYRVCKKQGKRSEKNKNESLVVQNSRDKKCSQEQEVKSIECRIRVRCR